MAFNRFVEKEKDRVAFKFSLIHHSIRLATPIFPLQSFSGEPFDSRKRNQFHKEVRSA